MKFCFYCLLLAILFFQSCSDPPQRVLVFSKTKGWKHTSIPFGMKAIHELGSTNGFEVDTTRDAGVFNEEDLNKYSAVVFLSTIGNVLNNTQQTAFERYIQAGGGFVGIHAAAATEYEWPWYNKLIGAHFSSHPHHPGVRPGVVEVVDSSHVSTRHLPLIWKREEEWYSYRSFYPDLKVLILLDENSYDGGTNGSFHPLAWYHDFDGGRAFYTGLGHQDESYSDPDLRQHILGGIQYAMAQHRLDYSKAYAVEVPEENRFQKKVLQGSLDNPMELAVSGDGLVFFTELRSGKLQVFDTKKGTSKLVHQFHVCNTGGTGLIGVTLDPNFGSNHFIYVYYAPPTDVEPIYFHLSRFTLSSSLTLDVTSEKILLRVPVQEKNGSHHGGSLAFDKVGNLYLSTGDSSSPFPSNGYAPLDERPGSEHYALDAQRGPSNSNDFKGKILRIHPETDGSYTIPRGNLFSKDVEKTKPEIYIMGCRNPYRIALHPKTSTLYWGDIGPDAGKDSIQGPMGYDEFNQAKQAGNYGWPYFIGNNQAYAYWNFETNQSARKFDPARPVNGSPNNTGIKELPPAQPAMIWYPYRGADEFPELGTGGRSAMVGAFYAYTPENADGSFPAYYDNALFVFDWMRNWVMALRFDDDEHFVRSEPFMATSGDFRRPIDLAFGHDGVMYMLEYGSVYGAANEDARLVSIRYNAGNRAPHATANIDDNAAYAALDSRVFLTSELKTLPLKKEIAGPLPLKVGFSSKGSIDPDDDDFKIEWSLDAKTVISTEANMSYTFTKPGLFHVILKVTDTKGATGSDTVKVVAGNARPAVDIISTNNKSFYWDNTAFNYRVSVRDEDAPVRTAQINVSLKRSIPRTSLPLGYMLLEGSDCKACHTMNSVSVGPSYQSIAQRYKGERDATDKLAKKIIAGGGGNWSKDHVMSAHPQLSTGQAAEIVKYILAIDDFAAYEKPMLLAGIFRPGKDNLQQLYTLTASYTDAGNQEAPGVANEEVVSLRYAKVPAVYADAYVGFQRFRNDLNPGHHKSYFFFKQVDLTGINAFSYEFASQDREGEIEVRMDSFAGPVIARVQYKPTGDWGNYSTIQSPVNTKISGKHDLYFIMMKREQPNNDIIKLRSIGFVQ